MTTNKRILRQRLLAVAVATAAILALPGGSEMSGRDVYDVGDYCGFETCHDWKCLSNGSETWKVFCARFWTELWTEESDEDD
jgi:hypothetical protein